MPQLVSNIRLNSNVPCVEMQIHTDAKGKVVLDGITLRAGHKALHRGLVDRP